MLSISADKQKNKHIRFPALVCEKCKYCNYAGRASRLWLDYTLTEM
jgi:hypothetical protein